MRKTSAAIIHQVLHTLPSEELRLPGVNQQPSPLDEEADISIRVFLLLAAEGDVTEALNDTKSRLKTNEQRLAIVKGLRSALDEKPTSVDEKWRWVRLERLLREVDPKAALPLDKPAAEIVESLLPKKDAIRKSSTLTELDRFSRGLKECLFYLEAENPAARESLDAFVEQLSSFSARELRSHVRREIDDYEKFVAGSRAASGRALSELLWPERPPGKEDPIRKLLEKSWRSAELRETFTPDGGKVIYSSGKAERWTVEPVPPMGAGLATLRSTKNPSCFVTLDAGTIADLVKTKSLDERLARAVTEEKQEQSPERKEALRKLELAKGKTKIISVLPKQLDGFTTPAMLGTVCLHSALGRRYGDLGPAALLITDDPMKDVRGVLNELAKGPAKASEVVLQISNHGTREGLTFVRPVTAKDLAALAVDYPDLKFHVVTLACYGGGLREGLLKEIAAAPALKSRLNVSLQTKPDVVNIAAAVPRKLVPGAPLPSTISAFHLHLIDGLLDETVKSFGEAIHRADIRSKDTSALDADAIIDGELHSRSIGEPFTPRAARERSLEALRHGASVSLRSARP